MQSTNNYTSIITIIKTIITSKLISKQMKNKSEIKEEFITIENINVCTPSMSYMIWSVVKS